MRVLLRVETYSHGEHNFKRTAVTNIVVNLRGDISDSDCFVFGCKVSPSIISSLADEHTMDR